MSLPFLQIYERIMVLGLNIIPSLIFQYMWASINNDGDTNRHIYEVLISYFQSKIPIFNQIFKIKDRKGVSGIMLRPKTIIPSQIYKNGRLMPNFSYFGAKMSCYCNTLSLCMLRHSSFRRLSKIRVCLLSQKNCLEQQKFRRLSIIRVCLVSQ